ncbi:MAG: hypothetical protein IJP48_00640 [Synergistaceae bacterium]|nr:hypothetical protein [Synergistaceae bacterium]
MKGIPFYKSRSLEQCEAIDNAINELKHIQHELAPEYYQENSQPLEHVHYPQPKALYSNNKRSINSFIMKFFFGGIIFILIILLLKS